MEIKDRISLIIKEAGLKKSEFANKIDTNPSYLSTILNGTFQPGEKMIKKINEVFNVNSDWLLTGKGNMYLDVTRENEVARFMERVLKNKESDIFKLIHALAKLDEDELEFLANITLKLANEQKKDD